MRRFRRSRSKSRRRYGKKRKLKVASGRMPGRAGFRLS